MEVKEIDGLHTAEEVAKMLGVNRNTIRRWRDTGRIVPVKVAGACFYPQSEIGRMKSLRALLSANRAAKALGIHRRVLRTRTEEGGIEYVQLGSRRYYTQEEIDRMKSQRGSEALR